MEVINITGNCSSECDHVLKDILISYQIPLSTISFISVILGLPLNINMLWHLQVANNNSGRGVLRLIRLQTHINFICVPLVGANLIILAFPHQKMPFLMCTCMEWLSMFIAYNGSFRGLMIALGRYCQSFANNKTAILLTISDSYLF